MTAKLKNSIRVRGMCESWLGLLICSYFLEREKVKRAAIDVSKIESVLNYPCEVPSTEGRCSPIFRTISPVQSTCPDAAGTPGTPVDIKSVPQIRQLSCKKLIYSYTFGSHCTDCSSNSCSSTDGSPNFFAKTAVNNRSPTSNCRQTFGKGSAQFPNLELSSVPIPTQSSFKRKN
jgi:hypothetical protein